MLAKGVVKSVQRGTYSASINATATNSIPISPVNVDRAVLFVHGEAAVSGNVGFFPIALSNNGGAIEIKNNTTYQDGVLFHWQVVEFY